MYKNASHEDNTIKPLLPFFWYFMAWTLFLQLAIWWLNQNTSIALFIQSCLAEIVGYFGNVVLDDMIVIENKLVHANSQRYVIVDDKCTGISLIATLWSAIFALQFRWILKIWMAMTSAVLIQFENIIRIAHLYNEIKYPINQFELYHLYIWQLINFITALAIFILIVWLANKYETRKLLIKPKV